MKIGLETFKTETVAGKRVGLVTNQTGIASDFKPTAQVLTQAGAEVRALFGPEHGYFGVEQAGINVNRVEHDPTTNAPIYSLYRPSETNSYGPPAGSLEAVDLLVFDLQDVGVRFYTYLATLAYVLEAAVQAKLPVLVLDRPNPIGGVEVEGPLLQSGFESFVGRYPVTVRHSLTLGEAAHLINTNFLGEQVRLEVARLEGWQRSMSWPDTNLPWVAPSPNLPTFQAVLLYPGLCLVEGTNLSHGRGTTQPFEFVGAPWLDNQKLAAELNQRWQDRGFYLRETLFKPTADRYAGEICRGVQVHLLPTNYQAQAVVRLGLDIIATAFRINPTEFEWRPTHFDRLIGNGEVRLQLSNANGDPRQLKYIFQEWAANEAQFTTLRYPNLLYN